MRTYCIAQGTLPSVLWWFKWQRSTKGELSHVWLFAIPWTEASQGSLSIKNSRGLPKLVSIESVMPSNFFFCRPFLLPSIFPSIRVFSNESALRIRWPKHWSFSFSMSPSNDIQDWFPIGWTGWIALQSKGLPRVFRNTTVQKHQCSAFFIVQLSHPSMTTGKNIALTKRIFIGKVISLCFLIRCLGMS